MCEKTFNQHWLEEEDASVKIFINECYYQGKVFEKSFIMKLKLKIFDLASGIRNTRFNISTYVSRNVN